VLLVRGSIIVSGLPAVRLDSPMPAVISAGLASVFAGEHAACARGHDELRHSTGSRPIWANSHTFHGLSLSVEIVCHHRPSTVIDRIVTV
jgi:hypothetical protein